MCIRDRYVATENPTENLKTLAEYIVKVYAPVWFNIKLKPSCTYGSKHLFKLISYSRYLSDDFKNVLDPVSYTHLDVYKRQTSGSSSHFNNTHPEHYTVSKCSNAYTYIL